MSGISLMTQTQQMDCWGLMTLLVCWIVNSHPPKSGPDCCNPTQNPTLLQILSIPQTQLMEQKTKHKNKYIISQDHPHNSQSHTFKEGILSLWTMITFWYLPKIITWSVWIWTIIKLFYCRNSWSMTSCLRMKRRKAMLRRKIVLRILQRGRMVRMLRIAKIVRMVSKIRTARKIKTVRMPRMPKMPKMQKTPNRPHPQPPWSRHLFSSPNPSSPPNTNLSTNSNK